MAAISLNGVTRRFPRQTLPAVDGVSLAVEPGEFVALLGPSGCGKTTLLRLVAGFERPDAGEIVIGGEVVAGRQGFVPPEQRGIGMVFQSYALWPHMSVTRNVGYPLEVRGVNGAAYRRRVETVLAAVGLTGFEARRPAELSGGQRQRVALARCLVMEPRVVLLDEPLANLDMHLRAALLAEFKSFRDAIGAAMIYVTHDQGEALAVADRIAVMDSGRILQFASPSRSYREPATRVVAGLIGRSTLLPGRVTGLAGKGRASVRLLGIETDLRAASGQEAGEATICLRPEDVTLGRNGVPARYVDRFYQGTHEIWRVGCADQTLLVHVGPEAGMPVEPLAVTIRDGWVIPTG